MIAYPGSGPQPRYKQSDQSMHIVGSTVLEPPFQLQLQLQLQGSISRRNYLSTEDSVLDFVRAKAAFPM